MSYASFSVVFGEQPSAAKWNILGTNDANFNSLIQPDGTAVKLLDSSGHEILRSTQIASAVNEITITNAATGNAPQISATGDDTNIDLKLAAKGTGAIDLVGAVLKDLVYRRQGGSSTVYSTAGTNNYTPTESMIIQFGVTAGSAGGDTGVTFPVAFSQAPFLVGTSITSGGGSSFFRPVSLTSSGFNFSAILTSGSRAANDCAWIAIGPK